MDKDIKIIDFVNGYNKCVSDTLKERYLKEKLKVLSYLPFNNKLELCNRIVKATSYKTDVITNNKVINISSSTRYFLYCRALIETYTNLENNTDDTNWLEEYDLLASSGLLDNIMVNRIPERETIELKNLLEMEYSDFITNNYETHAYISNQVDRISILADKFLSPLLDQVLNKVETMDKKDIDGLINKVSKIVNNS